MSQCGHVGMHSHENQVGGMDQGDGMYLKFEEKLSPFIGLFNLH
jgi:hypothetical protein